ncbi:hypothetical protein H8K32_19375 [Undibacterium jejuense]|uniref:Uncharacterized protein n=2 Tax=Undibacterium jejuense TaxID=1344949 RepID=A0A923KRR7_9BURK|nr:hypothetical protein [Undibacterium jejuense]
MTEAIKMGQENNRRYAIEGAHVIDTQTHQQIYIRALLDVGCYEYVSSNLPCSERLKIINAIGEQQAIAMMRAICESKGRAFDEEKDGRLNIKILKMLAESNY